MVRRHLDPKEAVKLFSRWKKQCQNSHFWGQMKLTKGLIQLRSCFFFCISSGLGLEQWWQRLFIKTRTELSEVPQRSLVEKCVWLFVGFLKNGSLGFCQAEQSQPTPAFVKNQTSPDAKGNLMLKKFNRFPLCFKQNVLLFHLILAQDLWISIMSQSEASDAQLRTAERLLQNKAPRIDRARFKISDLAHCATRKIFPPSQKTIQ